MTRVVVLLWLGTATARSTADPALEEWALARGVELGDPSSAPLTVAGYDAGLASRIDTLLDGARLAAASLDEVGALRRLAEVEDLLGRHPELPQAAWLLAERHRLTAEVVARRPDGAERALALEHAADLLEGRRADAYGARSARSPPSAESVPHATLHVSGLDAGDELVWDGQREGREPEAVLGQHHALVERAGAQLWAAWVQVTPGLRDVVLDVPARTPCSDEDLAGVRVVRARVTGAAGVRCRSWAVARASSHGGVQLATCRGGSCGPLLTWHLHSPNAFASRVEGAPLPSGHVGWLGWLMAGTTTAAIAGALLWDSGAFREPEPKPVTWRYQGPR